MIESRSQITNELWVVDEDVNVLAQAVVVSTHQHGTASERPFLYGKPEPLRVIDQYERALEQGFPLGKSWIVHRLLDGLDSPTVALMVLRFLDTFPGGAHRSTWLMS